ncbi:MAG TPA: glycerophosphodiester phosphodiesterase family protein [Steroidobacteraceae bacterium]|nr:glycerophosphodiester phosphodiesterase family protein [Steroidobacteraceae bacterium]
MAAPLLIAHRGASGSLPEHTLPAYALGILQGADFIEPDLVATRDGVLVARHENEISGTTDVAAHEEFASRRRSQSIDGVEVEGWFTEDFTLAELKTLRARERIPALRPQNARHDGEFAIPTLQEILLLLAQVNVARRAQGLKAVGIYPETKHPSHFAALGLPLEPLLLGALHSGAQGAPVYIQSFEVGNLRALRGQCEYPLVQLMSADGGPWDFNSAGTAQLQRRQYRSMATPEGLRDIARYAAAIGVQKEMVMPDAAADGVLAPVPLVEHAHAAGLDVHVWTFRAENHFLPPALRRGDDPAAHGDLGTEIRTFVAAGIDGLFSDHPALARAALQDQGITSS